MKNTTQSRDDKKSASATRNQMTEFLPTAAPAATNSAVANAGAPSASSQPTSSAPSSASDAANISNTSSEDQIRDLAYGKWEEAGCPECDGVEFWLAAERDLNSKSDISA